MSQLIAGQGTFFEDKSLLPNVFFAGLIGTTLSGVYLYQAVFAKK